MTNPRSSKKPAPYTIVYHPEPPARAQADKHYHVGAELSGPHLRLAALATDSTPALEPKDAFKRTGLLAVGTHEWEFEPRRSGGGFDLNEETITTVSAVLKQFLDELGIEEAQVARLRVGGVVTFDPGGLIVRVNTDAMQDRLEHDLPGIEDIGVGSRIRAALQVERKYGAGEELRPSRILLYLRLSEFLNFGADPGTWTSDGIFARGVRHAGVSRRVLEELGQHFIDGTFDVIEPAGCQVCRQEEGYLCLHSLASGAGIVELAARDTAAAKAAIGASTIGGRRFAEDRGARKIVDGKVLDSAAVFRAAGADEACQRIVLQAGVAIAIVVCEKIVQAGLLEPELVVIGGTIPFGTVDEDQEPLATRRTIDGVMQATMLHLLPKDRYRTLRVARSRFAGYTGLLGLTMPEFDGTQGQQ